MENQVTQTQETGVESVPAAGEQNEQVRGDEAQEQTAVQEQQTGVEGAAAAGQIKDEKDFAKALKMREEQLKQQLEREYAEKLREAEQHRQNLDRIAKSFGYESYNVLVQELEKEAQRRQIEEEARRLGVDPSVIQEYVQPMRSELQTLKQQLESYRQKELQRKIEAELNTLRSKYDDFGKYEDKVFETAIQRGIPLEDAYRIVSWEDKINAAKLAGEQEALQKLQQNATSTPGALGVDAPDQKFSFDQMSREEKRAFIEKVKRGEIRSLH